MSRRRDRRRGLADAGGVHFEALEVRTLLASGAEGLPAMTDSARLNLVPFPKEVRLAGPWLLLRQGTTIEAEPDVVDRLGGLLTAEFVRAGLPAPALAPTDGVGTKLRLLAGDGKPARPPELRAGAGAEDYVLRVSAGGASIEAQQEAGLADGVQTLCQLVRANRRYGSIPRLSIRDWPSIRWRGIQDDISTGPSSTLQTLEYEVDLAASLKCNFFTYHMKNQFAYAGQSFAPAGGALTPQELSDLVSYAAALGVNILGHQQSFAGLSTILTLPAYQHLAESDSTLSPAVAETYDFLGDLYGQVIPLLPWDYFNIGCDEVFDLGQGPAHDLVAQLGFGAVYARHVNSLQQIVAGYGKKTMLWTDVLLREPDALANVSTGVVPMIWCYRPADDYSGKIDPIADTGREFFVCPGTRAWGRVLPDLAGATVNIRNLTRDGLARGASGVLDTAWDADGEGLLADNLLGHAWAAECAWNGSTTNADDFNRRLGAVLFGAGGRRLARAIDRLEQAEAPWGGTVSTDLFWYPDLSALRVADIAAYRRQTRANLDLAKAALAELRGCRQMAIVNGRILDGLSYGARRLELISRRDLGYLKAALVYEQAVNDPPRAAGLIGQAKDILHRLRQTHADLRDKLVSLWNRENRPYSLDQMRYRYDQLLAGYDGLINRLAAARRQVRAGKRPPAPRQVGLEVVEARRT